jgi:hypothetical protein
MAQASREHRHVKAILYVSANARLPARGGPWSFASATQACQVEATLPGGLATLLPTHITS